MGARGRRERALGGVAGVALLALAAGVLTVGADSAASDSPPVVDVARTMSGPTSGQVGDLLTYTAALTINGPDPTGYENMVLVSDALDGNFNGTSYVGTDPSCGPPANTSIALWSYVCNYLADTTYFPIGTVKTVHLSLKVMSLSPTDICAGSNGQSLSETDPNPANDGQCVVLNPAPPPPTPPPTTTSTDPLPSTQPFSFVRALQHATQYTQYFAALIDPAPINLQPTPYVTLSSGTLPPGISISDNGDLYGKATHLGAFIFTVHAQWPQRPDTAKQATFTLVVDTISEAPASDPQTGKTIRLAKRTHTSGCIRGVKPDRRCSPGAYYSGLTKAVLCSSTFRTGTVRNVPDSEKHQVEVEYGMTPKAYGRTIEIDHIVSLEIGGSNDIANLYPEPGSGKASYHVKDKLENRLHKLVCDGSMTLHAAQAGIARNWETLYKTVFGVAP